MEEWVIIIMRYSDNLLIVSPSNLNTLLAQCDYLKFQLHQKRLKVQPLVFLFGIEIDTN